MRPSLSIIIPAFNEEIRLYESVIEVIKAASDAAVDYEVIIIDDASTDNTWEVVKKIKDSFPRVLAYRNEKNLGLGGSYKVGLRYSKKEHITWAPGDNSHPAHSLMDAFNAIGRADMVIPKPSNPEVRGISRRLLSKVYTKLVNSFSGLSIPYFNGLSIHRVDLLRGIKINTDGFGFQAEIIVKLARQGHSFTIVECDIQERRGGRSKAFTIKNIVSTLLVLKNLK